MIGWLGGLISHARGWNQEIVEWKILDLVEFDTSNTPSYVNVHLYTLAMSNGSVRGVGACMVARGTDIPCPWLESRNRRMENIGLDRVRFFKYTLPRSYTLIYSRYVEWKC